MGTGRFSLLTLFIFFLFAGETVAEPTCYQSKGVCELVCTKSGYVCDYEEWHKCGNFHDVPWGTTLWSCQKGPVEGAEGWKVALIVIGVALFVTVIVVLCICCFCDGCALNRYRYRHQRPAQVIVTRPAPQIYPYQYSTQPAYGVQPVQPAPAPSHPQYPPPPPYTPRPEPPHSDSSSSSGRRKHSKQPREVRVTIK